MKCSRITVKFSCGQLASRCANVPLTSEMEKHPIRFNLLSMEHIDTGETLKWDTNSVENIREDEMMFTCSIWLVNHGLHYSSPGINEPANTGEKQEQLHHLPSQTLHVADLKHLVALAVSSVVVLKYGQDQTQFWVQDYTFWSIWTWANHNKSWTWDWLLFTRSSLDLSTTSPGKPENSIQLRMVHIWCIWKSNSLILTNSMFQ